MKTLWLWLVISSLLAFIACTNDTTPQETAPESLTLSSTEQEQYLEKGKSIAGATFTALSSQLRAALQRGGVQEAVNYCNVVAYPLVDSLSKVHQASIRRTSLKIRNAKDAPKPHEQVALEQYQQMAADGEDLKPTVERIDEQKVAFYAPIMTMEMCLQCHGTVGEEVAQADYDLIKKLYPEDEAIGYSEGDWRGLWSIEFSTE